MTRIRKINVSQVEGNDANNTNTNAIRPYGEIAVYENNDNNDNKLELLMFDGSRTNVKSKVLSKGTFYGGDADSGDGLGLDTIKLIPDAELHQAGGDYDNDQYIVIDPTEPNHIHIRAGGVIDQSSAELFLGGELNNVKVSDTNNSVTITTDAVEDIHSWTFDTNGKLTLPIGGDILDSYGDSVLGVRNDQNVWVQTFESVDGTPTDMIAAALSVEYDSEGNLICLFSHITDVGETDSSYFSVAKISTTGTIIWRARFSAGFRTDGWGLAVDNNDAGSIYIAGSETSSIDNVYTKSILTKIDLADGQLQWSKIYDFGDYSESPVVDVASDGNPVMVGYAEDVSANFISVTKVDSTNGSVIWSKKFNGQGYENAYGMGVGPDGEVVAIGYIDQYDEIVASYPVTPQTGSTTDVLVINRSDLSNDTFTNSWKVTGTGITEYASISFINKYSGLTATVRQGSGAVFDIADNGDGTYLAYGVQNHGTNYRTGHKILVLGTDLGGTSPANDCTITVDSIDNVESGEIFNWSVTGTAAGTEPAIYTPVTGTNINVGSGLTFDLELDSGNTYTEHSYNITDGGTNYVTGDVVVIPGTQLGGTTPEHDLTATVSVADFGVVVQFNTFSGTQQTTTYKIIVAESAVDFSGTGNWTLADVTVNQDDRMLVVKYNSSGAIQWQKAVQFDTGYNCQGADCDIDSEGNIYVTGQYSLTDGPGVALSIVKFNSSGVAQWSRRVVGNCETFGTSIVIGPDNNLYLSGITAIQNNNFPNDGPPYSDTHSVLAKYSTSGEVLWQRLLENSSNWSFSGGFFGQTGASNLAVKSDYVVVSGGYGEPWSNTASASVTQVSIDGTVFSVGNWDFVASNFSGTFFDNASDITVTDAGKYDSDLSNDITVTTGVSDFDSSNFLVGTIYRASGSDERLINGSSELVLASNGTVTLPAGGTITEGIVTTNPTIQLTPASPDVASQKLVIKGGGLYSVTTNNITVETNNNVLAVSDSAQFYVYSDTYANQTLYWWIVPELGGIADPGTGIVELVNGSGVFTFTVDSDDYEFNVRVSPTENVYDLDTIGVESVLINSSAPAYGDYHLHLTTGDLTETSIFLGTDNHNVRTTTDGSIQITTVFDSNNNNMWEFDTTGNLTFPDGEVQSTAYAGGQGHMLMIDTNRTDTYTAVGTADKPFKTLADAMTACAIANPTGVLPYTFVLMGCTVSENVDFTSYNFNFITIATTCRTSFTGTFTAGNSNLKQLVIRNIEFANTFTLLGDTTVGQFANTSIYNASFSGIVNITCVNNVAFYEAAFFDVVTIKNINYMYINGGQFNTDLTFIVDDSGSTAIPANGIAPMFVIMFSVIANNVYMTKVGSGSGFLVFQPHMTRMGLSNGTYTIPSGFVFQPRGCAITGVWVNSGSVTIRDSSFDTAVTGTAPAYTGVIGGDRVIADKAPLSSKGATGDRVGMIAATANYLYVCTLDWTDGVADIWSRTAITASTW